MEGGADVTTAQLPRKLFTAHRKLLTDIDRCHTDLLTCDSQFQFDYESFNLERYALAKNKIMLTDVNLTRM